jgi:hypothetical protein
MVVTRGHLIPVIRGPALGVPRRPARKTPLTAHAPAW